MYKVGGYDNKKHIYCAVPVSYDYPKVISKVWQIKDSRELGLLIFFKTLYITYDNGQTIEKFVYNEEKKGYRPIESMEWE